MCCFRSFFLVERAVFEQNGGRFARQSFSVVLLSSCALSLLGQRFISFSVYFIVFQPDSIGIGGFKCAWPLARDVTAMSRPVPPLNVRFVCLLCLVLSVLIKMFQNRACAGPRHWPRQRLPFGCRWPDCARVFKYFFSCLWSRSVRVCVCVCVF